MDLISITEKYRQQIIGEWFASIISDYSSEAEKHFTKFNELFSNPVGSTIHKELEALYDSIFINNNDEALRNALENIIRIRAVQDFKPSEAIGFVFRLKEIINKTELVIPANAGIQCAFRDNDALEVLIEKLVKMSLDIYVSQREKLYEIKVNEIKAASSRMIERINDKYSLLE